MKNVIFKVGASLLVCLGMAFSACEDDAGTKKVHDPNKPIVLTDFYPKEGGIATKMIISGSNFGTDAKQLQVYFNETPAAVINSTGDKVYVIVPRKPGEDCTVSVQVGDNKATFDEHFQYHIQTTLTTMCGVPGAQEIVTGTLAETQFWHGRYLALDKDHNLFVCLRALEGGDYYNDNKVLLINEEEDKSQILIPNTGVPANQPCMSEDGETCYIPLDNSLDYWELSSKNQWAPRKMSLRKDPLSDDFSIDFKHSFAQCKYDGYMYTRAKNGALLKFDPETGLTQLATPDLLLAGSDSYILFSPFEGEEHILYLAYTNASCIYTYNLQTGEHRLYAGMTNVAGYADGPVEYALFNEPHQMILSPDNELYIADTNNHVIRKVTREGRVETVIGQAGVSGYVDGDAETALLNQPFGVAVDEDGIIYIGDDGNQTIRRLAIE